jgi:hypothetical protein
MNRGPETSFQEGDSQTLTMFLRFLGCSSFFLRLFDVQAIFFPLSRILNAKMHARMLWRRLRIALSFSLNFSFCQNEKPFSFDQNENNATFTENLKLFQWFKMFHSFIEHGLTPGLYAPPVLLLFASHSLRTAMAYFLTNAGRRRVSVGSIELAGVDLSERRIPGEHRRELDLVRAPKCIETLHSVILAQHQ